MEMKRYNVEAVRQRRVRAGITGTAMASIMGLHVPTYYKKEAGQIKWSLDEAKFLADYFKEPLDTLFFA